ncbi:MAG: AtpZ/AtpI family protein [Bacteroidia bacterium]
MPNPSWQRLAALGAEIVSAMLLWIGLGYAVDKWQQTTQPYFSLAGALIGMAYVFYRIFTALR